MKRNKRVLFSIYVHPESQKNVLDEEYSVDAIYDLWRGKPIVVSVSFRLSVRWGASSRIIIPLWSSSSFMWKSSEDREVLGSLFLIQGEILGGLSKYHPACTLGFPSFTIRGLPWFSEFFHMIDPYIRSYMEYKVFGCKTNKYFTERWLSHEYLFGKSWFFIASCVVTDRAKAKWLKFALRIIHRLHKWEKLYLSGCGSLRNWNIDPRFYEIYHELSSFQDRIELLPEDPSTFGWEKTPRLREKIRSLRPLLRNAVFTRKYIVIQSWCDNFCTFCLTVQARGRHRYREIPEIIREVREFEATGWKEIVLTGTNLGAWGAESSNDFQASRFVDLLDAILMDTSIARIRISSLGVEFCTPRLLEFFSHPRVIAYAHLSIQAWSTRILEGMRRHYDGERVRSVLAWLRDVSRADALWINIWADIIVGFPGETEADFLDTLALVEDFGISQLHVFPFSPHLEHYTVPASTFSDPVWAATIHTRFLRLVHAGERARETFSSRHIGRTLKVLMEKVDGSHFSWWSENYLACSEKNFIPFPWQEILRGKVILGTYNGLCDPTMPE